MGSAVFEMGDRMAEEMVLRSDIQRAQDRIDAMTEDLEVLTDKLEVISTWDFGSVATDLRGIAEELGRISELLVTELDGSPWLSTMSEIVSMAGGLGQLLPELDAGTVILSKLKGEIEKIRLLLLGEGGLLAGTSTGAIMGVVTAVVLAATIIVQNLDLIKNKIVEVWDGHLKPLWDGLYTSFTSMGESLLRVWNGLLKPILEWVIAVFEPLVTFVAVWVIGAVAVILSVIADLVDGSYEKMAGVAQFLSGVFTGDLEAAGEGISKVFASIKRTVRDSFVGVCNVCIWLVNGLIGIFYSLFGGVFNFIGGITEFVGNIFGKEWGQRVEMNEPYQIPYLARGAVLPANRPFLAMVGDQKHGVNVEAPLETIQEAVALVMGDQLSAMMAGFQSVIREQQALRATVEGIEVGDEVIGRAAARYGERMAVVRGGAPV